jgi:hypothetical protein
MTRLLLAALLAAAAFAAELDPQAYLVRVQALGARLEAGDQAGALAAAAALEGITVRWADGRVLPADPGLPALVRRGPSGGALLRVRALIAVLEGFRAAAPARAVAIGDAARALPGGLRQGGSLLAPDLEVPESWAERLIRIGERLGEMIRSLIEWIGSWFRFRSGAAGDGDAASMLWWVVGSLAVLLAAGVAVVLLRRAPPAKPAETTLPAAADADPTSRPADGWIARASELEAAGRHREAVRAWYHAVLAAAFASGQLHHRIGRTNWEYVAAVAVGAGWRTAFSGLTARFDRVWYGDHGSPAETTLAAEEAQAILADLAGGGAG